MSVQKEYLNFNINSVGTSLSVYLFLGYKVFSKKNSCRENLVTATLMLASSWKV
jgi:hypothetical protein